MKNYVKFIMALMATGVIVSANLIVDQKMVIAQTFVELIFALVIFTTSLTICTTWITYTGEYSISRKSLLVFMIVCLCICEPIVALLLNTNNFFFSFFLCFILFLPVFVITFLIKKSEFINTNNKYYLYKQGYNVHKPFETFPNGNLLLTKFIFPGYFIIDEFDKNYNKVPDGYNIERRQSMFMKNKKSIVQIGDKIYTVDMNGNKTN